MTILSTDPPAVPIAAIILGSVICLASAMSHWQFRSGWQMTEGRLVPSTAMRDLMIRLGYAALPNAITFGSGSLALVVMKIAGDSYTQIDAYCVILLAAVFICSAAWGVKEFYRPSRRRTPTWLE